LPAEIYLFLETTALYILLGWAIYLVYRIGQLYNMPIFTMGLGAYFAAFALRDWGWSYGLILLIAVAMGGVVAFLLSLALARASAFGMAIASIAPIIIFQAVVRNVAFLGGARGIYPLPTVAHLMPITLTATALIGFLICRLDHSRLGRAMEVVFVDPDVAATQGVTGYRLSVFLQTAAGAIGALAGAIYAPLMASIAPANFGFPLLLEIYCFLFVGGYTNMWGVVVFTPPLWGLRLVLPGDIATWTRIIYGVLLVTMVVLRPEGVITKQTLRSVRLSSQALLGRIRSLRQSGTSQ
jgi:branched-chain amino acid transport system permease protein